MRKMFSAILLLTFVVFSIETVYAVKRSIPGNKTVVFQGSVVSVSSAEGIISLSNKRKVRFSDNTRFFSIEGGELIDVGVNDFSKGDRLSVTAVTDPTNRKLLKGLVLIEITPPSRQVGVHPKKPDTVQPVVSSCASLPEPSGTVIEVGNVDELRSAIKNPVSPLTVLLKDGIYELDQGLWIDRSNITFRGKSGNRDAVQLKGKGMNGSVSHVFWVAASSITIADMTVGWVFNHPIQVHGELNADNVHVRNVRVVDGKEQLLKVSYDSNKPDSGADNGVVECSLFEYSAGVGPQSYIGGIDAHHAKNWVVRDNIFKFIKSPGGGIAEHAIHFWSNSENTIVERNIIINSDRGIGFGLGDRGHKGGVIRNNMIYHDSSWGDVGIGLENAAGAVVANNSIFHEHDYPNAIEYRFRGTRDVLIVNNLLNKAVTQRDGAQALLENNLTGVAKTWFKDPALGDMHLAVSEVSVIDKGKDVPQANKDFDNESRPAGKYDIGADEL